MPRLKEFPYVVGAWLDMPHLRGIVVTFEDMLSRKKLHFFFPDLFLSSL